MRADAGRVNAGGNLKTHTAPYLAVVVVCLAAFAAPGKTLNLTAVVAPDARAAAHYYPAGYWFSLIRVPAKSEFGPTGADGNGGAAPNVRSQAEWIRILKSGGCWACHQLGSL